MKKNNLILGLTIFFLFLVVLFSYSDYLAENFKSYQIPFDSMSPIINTGDYILVDIKAYEKSTPKRGDVVVFHAPFDNEKILVKRIVGLPKEKVEIRNGKIFINNSLLESASFPKDRYYLNHSNWNYAKPGQIVEVPEASYYVLGDQSTHSSDSRKWGFVPWENLIGRAKIIYWPPWRWKTVK